MQDLRSPGPIGLKGSKVVGGHRGSRGQGLGLRVKFMVEVGSKGNP